jgi:hypothetical protein
MIVKIRARIVFDFTYDADSADYDVNTPEEILNEDKRYFEQEGAYEFLHTMEPEVSEVEFSIVKDDENGN